MSQCSRDTSSANAAIALSPTEPTTYSRTGASASSARPIRSSLRASGAAPNTSLTAQGRAQSATCTNGRGEVSRFAISASMT